MISLAAAEWAGIALFLIPVPVAVGILIVGARTQRTDIFLLLTTTVTLLPAVWATAVRAGWGGCDGCLSAHEEDLMTIALASVPLLAVAIGLLVAGRPFLAAAAAILAQIAVGVGVWLPNKGVSLLMLAIIAAEIAYLVSTTLSRRNVESISAGNGHPPGTRILSRED